MKALAGPRAAARYDWVQFGDIQGAIAIRE